jgi:hypothetical protein
MLVLLAAVASAMDLVTSLQGAFNTIMAASTRLQPSAPPDLAPLQPRNVTTDTAPSSSSAAALLLHRAAQSSSPFAARPVFSFIEGDAAAVRRARQSEARGRREEQRVEQRRKRDEAKEAQRKRRSETKQFMRVQHDEAEKDALCASGHGPCARWCVVVHRRRANLSGVSSWASTVCMWRDTCCGCAQCRNSSTLSAFNATRRAPRSRRSNKTAVVKHVVKWAGNVRKHRAEFSQNKSRGNKLQRTVVPQRDAPRGKRDGQRFAQRDLGTSRSFAQRDLGSSRRRRARLRRRNATDSPI